MFFLDKLLRHKKYPARILFGFRECALLCKNRGIIFLRGSGLCFFYLLELLIIATRYEEIFDPSKYSQGETLQNIFLREFHYAHLKFNSSPLKNCRPQRKGSSSNHPCSGADWRNEQLFLLSAGFFAEDEVRERMEATGWVSAMSFAGA